MSDDLDHLDNEFHAALAQFNRDDEAWTDEDQARYDAEAEAYFAALDYGYDNVAAKPAVAVVLPRAQLVRPSLWTRVRAWVRGKEPRDRA